VFRTVLDLDRRRRRPDESKGAGAFQAGTTPCAGVDVDFSGLVEVN
jgi:hypothetical protein